MEMATTFIYLNTSLGNVLAIALLDYDVKCFVVTWIGNVNTRSTRFVSLFFFNLDTFIENSYTERFRLL